jgi:hypothetical protein
MNPNPKYLLKYSGREIESNSLDELLTLAKHLTEYYEIFRVYRAVHSLERKKTVFDFNEIQKAIEMEQRGYKRDVIARRMGMTRFYLDKALDANITV